MFICHKANPFIKQGTFWDRTPEGWQEVNVDTKRKVIYGYVGLVYPYDLLDEFLLEIRQWGFDGGASRQDRRRREEKRNFEDPEFEEFFDEVEVWDKEPRKIYSH